MNNFVRNLLTEWRSLNLPFEEQTFVVAVSGGADSVSLALALSELKRRKKLNLRFVAAHFNHDLRGRQSDEDEKFVRELAGKFGFELALKKGNIAGEGNLEQNARVARYEFLTETAENLRASGVLTAHTLNDQAETFLINLIRGSGLEGLGARQRASQRRLQGEDRIAFTYEQNPNGSMADIAGVLSDNRRVLGMMPHPERACEPVHGGTDGAGMFKSLMGGMALA